VPASDGSRAAAARRTASPPLSAYNDAATIAGWSLPRIAVLSLVTADYEILVVNDPSPIRWPRPRELPAASPAFGCITHSQTAVTVALSSRFAHHQDLSSIRTAMQYYPTGSSPCCPSRRLRPGDVHDPAADALYRV